METLTVALNGIIVGTLEKTAGGEIGIAPGIDLNPFPLSDEVLVSEHFPTQQYRLLMHGFVLHLRAS
ncbi:TPA: hypothetical protein RJ957_002944 [Enterobacter hormaechei]|nr:hypothetical protein [Enterobacter hormaechei]HDV8253709.1 hypothetical protein [Enterobacter hormaechei]